MKNPFKMLTTKGLSLIEVMMGLAITSVLVQGAVMSYSFVTQQASRIEGYNEQLHLAEEIRILLSDENFCLSNLSTSYITMDQLSGSNVVIYGNPAAKSDPIAQPGLPLKHTIVESVKLLPEAHLGAGKYFARLEILTSAGNHKDRLLKIPLIAYTNAANRVIHCSTRGMTGQQMTNDALNRLCYISSNGTTYYSTPNKRCVTRFETKRFYGDAERVSCPTDDGSDWSILYTSYCYAERGTCSPPSGERPLIDGGINSGTMPCGVATRQADLRSCSCVWASGGTPGQCSANCSRVVVEIF